MKNEKENIFQNKKWTVLLALICVAGWSMAYPFIKMGMKELQIEAGDLGGKILFGGVRFFLAGLLVLLISVVTKKELRIKTVRNWWLLFVFGIVNTFMHYTCSYIGLAYLTSSRSIIIDSMGAFFMIGLSCLFMKDDAMTRNKLLGCVLGFSGILLINVNPDERFLAGFSLAGDGMLLLGAVAAGFGGILTRIVTRKVDPTTATGYGMTFGGALMIAAGYLCGGKMFSLTVKGFWILFALVMISAVCFGIYNQLLCYHPISKIAIYNALIPILGVVFSGVILGETIELRYVGAGILVACGVYLLNKGKK